MSIFNTPTKMTDRISLFKLHTENTSVCLGKDASMKKHTSLLKKIKNISSSTVDNILKDISALTLTKYLDELVVALIETRPKHHLSWLLIASSLYLRFKDDFTKPLAGKALKLLQESCFQQQADGVVLASARHAMRVLIDLNLTGMIEKTVASQMMVSITHIVDLAFKNDPNFSNLQLLVSFVKTFGNEFAVESDSDELPDSTFMLPLDVHRHVLEIIKNYFQNLSKKLQSLNRHIMSMEKKNAEYELTRGNLPPEKKEKLDLEKSDYEAYLASAQTIADVFTFDMPDLKSEEENNLESSESIGIVIEDGSSLNFGEKKTPGSSIWEDEEERDFYENIPDLANFVPPALLAQGKPGKKSQQIQQLELTEEKELKDDLKKEDLENLDKKLETLELSADDINENTLDNDNDDEINVNVEDDESISASKDEPQLNLSIQADLDTFISRLTYALNPQTIDAMAIDFMMMNSKLSRRKLVKAMLAVPRTRTDLLPYYSRLLAILNKYFNDVSELAVDQLQREFFYHFKKKDQIYVDDRLKNIKFICELVKFNVAPLFMIFRCIHKLLMDFSHFNVDVTCTLIDCIGRFMMRHPVAKTKFAEMIEIMMRKKSAQTFDIRQTMMIESAYFVCYPIETKSEQVVETPMEAYLSKLIYKDLSVKNSEFVLKQLRKLNWDDKEKVGYVLKRFLDLERIKYANIECIAWLTYELGRYYPNFKVSVIDHCLEYIRQGLEFNFFAWNQKRIGMVRFLTELYNYRCFSHKLIFDTLYFILRFGHDKGIPRPDIHSPYDAPFDFFRIRLVCTIVDLCGMYFDKGSSKRRLDDFLVFFQLYIYTKVPPPMDIDFLINDTIDNLRPKMVWYNNYHEAAAAVNELAVQYQTLSQNNEEEDEENEEEDIDEVRESRNSSSRPEHFGDQTNSDDNGEDAVSENNLDSDVSTEDEIVILDDLMTKNAVTEEEIMEFDSEYNKMMLESLESRKFDKKVQSFDVPVPLKMNRPSHSKMNSSSSDENDSEQERSEENNITFSILSKKAKSGSGIDKQVSLPVSSQFVQSALSRRKELEQEKMALKEWVLGYGQRLAKDTGNSLDGKDSHGHGRLRKKVVYKSSSKFKPYYK